MDDDRRPASTGRRPRRPSSSDATETAAAGTPGSAYLHALKMLARRELSEAQVRQRLARKACDEADVDTAIARLRADRSLDDWRVALAIARTQQTLRNRGRLRVRREIEQAGIGAELARQAVDEVFAEIPEDEQIETALRKRLRGRSTPADASEFNRLYRYLTAQGFEPNRVLARLKTRSVK